MKKTTTFSGILLVSLLITSLVMAIPTDNPDQGVEIEALMTKVKALEARILLIEARMKKLEYQSVSIPSSFPRMQKIPKGWTQKEFNGMKYYVIPVSNEKKSYNRKK